MAAVEALLEAGANKGARNEVRRKREMITVEGYRLPTLRKSPRRRLLCSSVLWRATETNQPLPRRRGTTCAHEQQCTHQDGKTPLQLMEERLKNEEWKAAIRALFRRSWVRDF